MSLKRKAGEPVPVELFLKKLKNTNDNDGVLPHDKTVQTTLSIFSKK